MSTGPDPTPNNPFGGLMPGLDMWKGLLGGARKAVPGLSSLGAWATPTLDPAELDKRIEELRTVQFWLEQNAKMIGTTIQALEVQRMTLSTLQTLNVKFGDLKEAMSVRPAAPPAPTPAGAPNPSARTDAAREAPQVDGEEEADAGLGAAEAPESPETSAASTSGAAKGSGARRSQGGAAEAPAAPLIDPMQWWGQLTQQFSQIAQQAQQAVGSKGSKTRAATAEGEAPDPAPPAAAKAAARPKAAATGRKKAPAKPAGSATRKPAAAAPRKR